MILTSQLNNNDQTCNISGTTLLGSTRVVIKNGISDTQQRISGSPINNSVSTSSLLWLLLWQLLFTSFSLFIINGCHGDLAPKHYLKRNATRFSSNTHYLKSALIFQFKDFVMHVV